MVPRSGIAISRSLPVGRSTYPTSTGRQKHEKLFNLWITSETTWPDFYAQGHDDDPFVRADTVTPVSRWARVFHAHKTSKLAVSVTLVSQHTWHLRITRVGSDYAAGDTLLGVSKSVVFLFKNIEAVTGATPLGVTSQTPPVASNFLAMVNNLSRLSKKVVVHTLSHQWAGVLSAVDVDHLTVGSHTGHRVVVSVASISWIAVEGNSDVDNPTR